MKRIFGLASAWAGCVAATSIVIVSKIRMTRCFTVISPGGVVYKVASIVAPVGKLRKRQNVLHSRIVDMTQKECEMKAIQVHEHGDADNLVYEDVPMPEPGQDEVRVKVEAVGV